MGARFRVLIVGKSRASWAQEAVNDYTKRLKRHGSVEEIAVKAETFRGDIDAVRAQECQRLLKRLRPKDRLVVLDERGEGLVTSKFTKLVDQGRQSGTLVFVIGGAYGHDPALRERAWRVIKLSDMVLNHELARVVLYEQLYRAMTQIAGVPYHH